MKKLLLALALILASLGLAGSPAVAYGTGGSGTLLPLCSTYGIATVDAVGSASYADPFYDGWIAEAHVTGYIGYGSIGGYCPSTQLYGDATHTSYGVRLIVLRHNPFGWVNCGDTSDYTTGQNRAQASVSLPVQGLPAICYYHYWPAGETYIFGHITGLWNPTGALYDPGTRGSQVEFGFYV